MTEIQILSAVKNNGGSIAYTELLSLNLTDPYLDATADKERIKKMMKAGLLEGETRAYGSISITDAGRLFLQDACYNEEQKHKLAKDSANERSNQQRHEWKITITSIVLTALLGILVDVLIYILSTK